MTASLDRAGTSAAAPADLGLFGPDSVTWRVHGSLLLAVGGLRALFLQALHPRAMAGVAQNSGFREDPWGRLYRTGDYVATVTFGTTAEARRAAARVRGIHRRLRGHDPYTGAEFRVDDPELLRWTHVCEVESFATTAQRGGVRLTDTDLDRYYTEQLRAAELVGLDPATVPSSVAAVADYYAEMRPRLALTKDAAAAAGFLFWPRMPWPVGLSAARGGWMGVTGLAFGLLPGWARRAYGAVGLPVADHTATLAVRSLAGTLALLPERIRHSPRVRDGLARARAAGRL
ncbi:MAG TPA: oxygenase MpaB family protein [Actinocatenispora sp.]